MVVADVLGLVAGGLTTAAFVPQVLKTWRTRSAGDVSLVMFGIMWLGVGLWIAYGVLIRSTPVVVANVVTFGLVTAMLALKGRFSRRRTDEVVTPRWRPRPRRTARGPRPCPRP